MHYASVLQKIPVLIVLVILSIAVVIIYFRSKNVTRSEFVKIFKGLKYFQIGILITTILITGVFGIFNHIHAKQSVSAVISLNYSEASHALNSNSTRYNMAEIICDDVVKRAIEIGAFEDVSFKDLKKCLCVFPYVQGGVEDKSQYHISTEFVLEYHASKDTQHLDAENVIQLIACAYKEYYIDKYTDNFMAAASEERCDFSKMEYMDIVTYFNREANGILNYLYGMAAKAQNFVTEKNTTFNSIAGKVYQFKQTQIEQNLQALILQNGIARNTAEYIDRLSYQNKNTDFDRAKDAVSFDLCNQAIQMYSEEMTRVVLVPTWDEVGKYYMGRTKVGIDELSVKATEFSNSVASNEKAIMDNNLVISKMSAGSNAGALAQIDELVLSIDSLISEFTKEAVSAGREFANHQMNQCVAVSITGTSLFAEAKTVLIFAALAYFALLMLAAAKKFPRREY